MMSRLYALLHVWAALPHEYGVLDCMLMPADWVRDQRGFDPAADWRGKYGHPDLCPLGRQYRADPVPLWRHGYAALPEVETAQTGDVALVTLPGERWLIGAIRLRGRDWAMKLPGKGVLATRAARPVLIYGVGYAG